MLPAVEAQWDLLSLGGGNFSGAFAKLRKATISFAMSVCLSACSSARKKSASTGQIFIKSDMRIFRKSVGKIQVSLKSEKNNE
jgi:predicted component of type VI protein secretion system